MFVGGFQVEGEIDVSRCKVKGEDESEGFAHHGRKREQEAPSRAFTQESIAGDVTSYIPLFLPRASVRSVRVKRGSAEIVRKGW
jgi:hypothetical protein